MEYRTLCILPSCACSLELVRIVLQVLEAWEVPWIFCEAPKQRRSKVDQGRVFELSRGSSTVATWTSRPWRWELIGLFHEVFESVWKTLRRWLLDPYHLRSPRLIGIGIPWDGMWLVVFNLLILLSCIILFLIPNY